MYILTEGELIVEKRVDISSQDPYRKTLKLQDSIHWLAICSIGPGSLVGEELLLEENINEEYEFRTTV